ncbi:hypothetical protein LTR57_025721, partial [Friedmanniomyces endolithicus]
HVWPLGAYGICLCAWSSMAVRPGHPNLVVSQRWPFRRFVYVHCERRGTVAQHALSGGSCFD